MLIKHQSSLTLSFFLSFFLFLSIYLSIYLSQLFRILAYSIKQSVKVCFYLFIYLSRYLYLPTPPLGQDMTQGHFFKRSLIGLNSECSFTKAKELSLSYYLPIAGGRIIGFIPFLRVLVLCEMQIAWFRIWTRVAVSISYDDNHYTTGTSHYLSIYLSVPQPSRLGLWKTPTASIQRVMNPP